MFYLRGMVIALALLAALPLAAGEPVLTPQQGLLLLRNGNVMQGAVTRAGDYYIVIFGDSGEVRLAAADVETLCVDLEDAYRYRAATMVRKGAAPHLDLAEWCLRHGLVHQAGEQLVAAMRQEPANRRIAAVERKIKLALEAPKSQPVRQTETAATVSAEQLDKTIRGLPPGSVERFAAVVQPILLNRCAAGGCHGPNTRSDFRLLRPPGGLAPSKRFTERNLYAVLAYLDKERFEASPLLAVPQQRHGSTLGPVFDKRTQHQLDELIAWTRLALDVPTRLPVAKIVPRQALLSQQQDGGVKLASAEVEVDPEQAAAGPAAADEAPQPFQPPRDAAPLAPEGAFTPRDPFDPEIFNRQFRKK
jgi:hypothetical protein